MLYTIMYTISLSSLMYVHVYLLPDVLLVTENGDVIMTSLPELVVTFCGWSG